MLKLLWLLISNYSVLQKQHSIHLYNNSLSILLFKGFPLFGIFNIFFLGAKILLRLLCLSMDKTKKKSGKKKTLINFQITLSIYKLDSQNKNYIYKIKTQFFLAEKSIIANEMRLVLIKLTVLNNIPKQSHIDIYINQCVTM